MPGDRVLSGVLRNIGQRIPAWVYPTRRRQNYVDQVYVRLSNSRNLAAELNEVVHFENDETVQGFRCYIPIPNNIILTANLVPYDYNQHFSSIPRIFVRIPFQNNVSYTGILQRGHRFHH